MEWDWAAQCKLERVLQRIVDIANERFISRLYFVGKNGNYVGGITIPFTDPKYTKVLIEWVMNHGMLFNINHMAFFTRTGQWIADWSDTRIVDFSSLYKDW